MPHRISATPHLDQKVRGPNRVPDMRASTSERCPVSRAQRLQTLGLRGQGQDAAERRPGHRLHGGRLQPRLLRFQPPRVHSPED